LAFSLAFVIAATAGASPRLIAQQPITIPNSEIHDLHSKVNDSDYKLFIILPKSYSTNTGKHFPVFYLLDGNDTATIAWLTRSRQHSDASDLIFVGIGYPEPLAGPPIPLPGKSAVPAAQRSADYATYNTTEPWSPPKDKGAGVFLQVIQKEIIPYMDGHYRTDPAIRGLGGHSLGGLFATYAVFHASDTFNRFWIGSPSLLWDHSVLFGEEAEFAATHHDLNARIIADVGGQESKTFNRDTLFAMGNKVKSHGYPHLVWKTIVLPNEDHGTLPLRGHAASDRLSVWTTNRGTRPAGAGRHRGRLAPTRRRNRTHGLRGGPSLRNRSAFSEQHGPQERAADYAFGRRSLPTAHYARHLSWN
jgi:predicted alpha/beta superfamily hydrolase